MSGLAGLYNVPGTPEEWDQWNAIHAAHHRDINRVIYEIGAIALPEFLLDPFNADNAQVWLRQHQTMHENFDTVLQLSGYNLLDVNWSDKSEFASWIQLHASEHYQAAAILGIG